MPVYQWVGQDFQGGKHKGEMEAANLNMVRARLLHMQIRPDRIRKKPKDLFENLTLFQPCVRPREIVLFIRQFATMIEAGIPIIQCLEALRDQQGNRSFKRILNNVRDRVEGGATLADAFAVHPKQFDSFFVHMVAAGEAGGVLELILMRLAGYMEKSSHLKSRVKGALIYPAITIFVSVVVVTAILVFVIPVFEHMFKSVGGQLPLPTRIVVGVSAWLKHFGLYLLIGVIFLTLLLMVLYRTRRGRLAVDRLMLKLPLFGSVIQKAAIAKFSRTLGVLLSGGVVILDAMDIVAKTFGNRVIENALHVARRAIVEGKSISEPLAHSGAFPPMVHQMVNVGEATGKVDAMLIKIADFYDQEVDQAVENFMTTLEPVIIVLLGMVIGAIVISMYLPMFKLAGTII
jgi:type IV pilus assembly protein PilC